MYGSFDNCYHPSMPMSANIRASLYMMLSMSGFTINDLFIKSLDGDLPIGQIMAIRGIFLSVMITLIAVQQGVLKRYTELFTPMVALRSAGETGATLLFLTALTILPFSTISAILQSLPLVVALGAALLLKETIGWRRWIAILIGFIGVLIIIRPGAEGFQPATILMILSVLFAAGRDLTTRCLPKELPSLLVSLATAVSICLVGAALSSAQNNWQPVNGTQLGTLFIAACFLFFGYQFLVLAMRTGEIAYVVPYRYTSLLWAIAGGYLVFSEVPDRYTLIGSAIVVATGLFTLYRELVAGRRAITSTSIHARGNVWSERKK